MYRIALLMEKFLKRSAIKAQQILKTLVRNATSAMLKKIKAQLSQMRRLRFAHLCNLVSYYKMGNHKVQKPKHNHIKLQ